MAFTIREELELVFNLMNESKRLKEEKKQLVRALKAALEHENHEEGECGCGWTLKAETVLKSIGEV